MTSANLFFKRRTGVGLVISSMIGSGVFLSSGFMMQNQSPGGILLSWLIGALIALSGTRAYAELARINNRSGGEYRFLYDYFHPFVGYLSGWASLLIGFSAPIAIDAYAAGAFLNKAGLDIHPKITGIFIILALTVAHAFHLHISRWIQDLLAFSKFFFILIFVTIGLILGHNAWPQWQVSPQPTEISLAQLVENQYWIAFAFSGWNAAIYIADEYKNGGRDVYFSLIAGCLSVAFVYFAINWIFIANLTPTQSLAVIDYDKTQTTLAHIVMEQIIGVTGAQATSIIACLVFLAAISSMTLVGPRIYSQMAKDGLLPRFFSGKSGSPPKCSIFLQSGIALFLLHTQSIRDIVLACSSVLMLFSMLTVLILFRLAKNDNMPTISKYSLVSAVFYAASVIVILYSGIYAVQSILYVFSAILIAGSAGYWIAVRQKAKY